MSVRRLVVLAALAGATLAPSASAATCAGVDTQISSATLDAAREAVLCLVNAERTVRGLPAVTASDKLALAAQRHTDDMVARNYFDHYAPAPAPYGADPGARITGTGYSWWAYGENIAVGYRTPRSVMTGWMASEGHCTNILDPNFTQLGVGAASAAATIAGGFGSWTQEFGRPRGVSAPSSDRGPQQGCPYADLQGVAADGTILGDAADRPSGAGAAADPGAGAATAPSDPSSPSAGETPPPGSAAELPDVQSAPLPQLAVEVRRAGRRLSVAGALAARDRTRVRVAVLRRGRAVRRATTRLHGGRFSLGLRTPRGTRRLTVVVTAGGQRVIRSVR